MNLTPIMFLSSDLSVSAPPADRTDTFTSALKCPSSIRHSPTPIARSVF